MGPLVARFGPVRVLRMSLAIAAAWLGRCWWIRRQEEFGKCLLKQSVPPSQLVPRLLGLLQFDGSQAVVPLAISVCQDVVVWIQNDVVAGW